MTFNVIKQILSFIFQTLADVANVDDGDKKKRVGEAIRFKLSKATQVF